MVLRIMSALVLVSELVATIAAEMEDARVASSGSRLVAEVIRLGAVK